MAKNSPLDNPVLPDTEHWSYDEERAQEARRLQKRVDKAGGMTAYLAKSLGVDLSVIETLMANPPGPQ